MSELLIILLEFKEKSRSRINEIAQYCHTPTAMFPTPIILSGKSKYFKFKNSNKIDDTEFRNYESGIMEIDVNSLIIDKSFLSIVDGQHRLAGISASGLSEKFDLLAMFIFDTESYEDANIFSVINRNQKQVSKSLVYDLYGLTDEMTVEKFAHEIVKELNSSKLSLLQNKIKMLGYKDDTFGEIQLVSQGILVDRILPTLSSNYIKDNESLREGSLLDTDDRRILRKYLIADDLNLAKIHLISFFNVWIEILKLYFTDDSILFKSVGFIAAFKVIEKLYIENKLEIFKIDEITQNTFEITKQEIDNYQRLYHSLIENLNFKEIDKEKISSSFSGANYIVDCLFS